MKNPLRPSSSPSLPNADNTAPAPAPTSSGPPREDPTATPASDGANATPTAASASTRDDASTSDQNTSDRPSTSALSNPPSKTPQRASTSGVSSLRSSFLSRLSLPLPNRARNRHVLEFHINPHEPHKRYSPGDHVRGSVQVVVVKPLRLTHLTVALAGYVRVFKDPTMRAQGGSMQDVTALLPHGESKKPQYHGNGFASLFQDEQVLSGDGRLDAGKYEFGFDLVFPSKGLPSSIDVSLPRSWGP